MSKDNEEHTNRFCPIYPYDSLRGFTFHNYLLYFDSTPIISIKVLTCAKILIYSYNPNNLCKIKLVFHLAIQTTMRSKRNAI